MIKKKYLHKEGTFFCFREITISEPDKIMLLLKGFFQGTRL